MNRISIAIIITSFFFHHSFAQNKDAQNKSLQKNGLPAGVSVIKSGIKKDHITVINNSNNQSGKRDTYLKPNPSAAYPDWYYIRPDKTGVAGDYHYTVNGDRFGNVWMGGFMVFWEQGSVVRFDSNKVFTDWGSYDGYLPNARVTKILFDKTDRLWVGTDDGIAMYDNKKWTQFTTQNTTLPFAQVTGMAVDSKNQVWVTISEFGTYNGAVAFYNGKKWTTYTTQNSGLPTQIIQNVAIDKNNNKWFASGVGLIKFDGTNWTVYNNQNSGMRGPTASDVEVDSLNRVWLTTDGSIDIYDGVKFKHVARTGWPANFAADQLFVRGSKVMVNDVAYMTLTSNNGTSWQLHYTNDLVFDNYIDTKGNFWAAGIGFVSRIDNAQTIDYTRYNTQLAEYFNNDIYVDKNNNKWFANGNGGIQVFDCPHWEEYGPWNGGLFPVPETFSTIGTSVTQDSYGDIWMSYDGTYGYAVQIPGGNYKNYNAWKTWSDTNTTLPFFQFLQESEATTNGKVFFRSYEGNVFMYDHATNAWKQFMLHKEITQNPFSMGHDYKGNLYLGGYQQIQTYKNNKWSTTKLGNIGIGYVLDIAFDSLNNMWLGTDSGVWKYDGKNWKNWTKAKDGIAADYVRTIKAANGKIYIGAYNVFTWPYYGGISIFDGTKWTTFLEGSSPLPHKQVEGLDVDKYGNLWIIPQSEAIAVYRPGGVLGFDCIDTSIQIGNAAFQIALSGQSIQNISSAQLSVLPNPAKNFITVKAPAFKNKMVIQIYDVAGKMVFSKLEQNGYNLKLDVSNLYKGLYIVKIRDNNGTIQSAKFMKE